AHRANTGHQAGTAPGIAGRFPRAETNRRGDRHSFQLAPATRACQVVRAQTQRSQSLMLAAGRAEVMRPRAHRLFPGPRETRGALARGPSVPVRSRAAGDRSESRELEGSPTHGRNLART